MISYLLSPGINLSGWPWPSLITALCLPSSAPVAQCPKMYINARSCLKMTPRGRQCTKSITSDKLDVIWPWYGRTAGYWVRSGHAGIWTFNLPQICPRMPAYNFGWIDMYYGGQMCSWVDRAVFWVIFLTPGQCTYMCINAATQVSTHIFAPHCRDSRANACLWTLGKGSPPY